MANTVNTLLWGKPSKFQKAPAYLPSEPTYVKTTDTSLVSGKTYYTQSSGTYTAVSSPNASNLSQYYEKNTGRAITCNEEDESRWVDLDLPKEDSLQLNTQEGNEVEAKEEGGDIVAVRYGQNNYDLQWDEYAKIGKAGWSPAFEDVEGIVEGEWAIRILAEDSSLPGIFIPRCKVRVTTSFTTADGLMRHYTCKVMKPESGKKVRLFPEQA